MSTIYGDYSNFLDEIGARGKHDLEDVVANMFENDVRVSLFHDVSGEYEYIYISSVLRDAEDNPVAEDYITFADEGPEDLECLVEDMDRVINKAYEEQEETEEA